MKFIKIVYLGFLLLLSQNLFAECNQLKPENNMPWIVALGIGVLSVVVNFIISWQMRIFNQKNLKQQIESNKDIKLIEYYATVTSQNQQEWVNEVRQTLTDFLTNSALIVESSHPGLNPKLLDERQKYIQAILMAKSNLELLLSEKNIEEMELLTKVNKMFDLNVNEPIDYALAKQIARNDVLSSARHLFEINWDKIKNLKLK
jgi:hypothetical protein